MTLFILDISRKFEGLFELNRDLATYKIEFELDAKMASAR